MPHLLTLLQDLKIGLIFYTRLPFRHQGTIEGADLARVTWANPLVGAVVGAIAALVYWLCASLGLPPLVAALLCVTASLLTTGCFHEDGLADTADGFGGGWTRERKLEIMRDSRHGSYGVAALVLALGLRVAALAALAEPEAVALALIASNAGARALIPLMMRALPNARTEGLSAYAGRPSAQAASTALIIAIVGMLLLLGGAATFAAMLMMLLTGLFMGWLAARQIGGYTGDVLGASEQVAEIAILLAIFVSWSN